MTRSPTKRCGSAPKTDGTWPSGWLAERASSSATPRAPTRPPRVPSAAPPAGGANFSETHAAAAPTGGGTPSDVGFFYLVSSIRKGVVGVHKPFAWGEETKTFVETAMTVIGYR